MLSLRSPLSSEQMSTTGPIVSNRFLLRSRCTMLGHVSAIDSSAVVFATAMRRPSKMTVLRSLTCANFFQTLSKPTSSATLLPEILIWDSADASLPCDGSARYFSLRADRKLWGWSSLGRVGRTKDAAVADVERPAVCHWLCTCVRGKEERGSPFLRRNLHVKYRTPLCEPSCLPRVASSHSTPSQDPVVPATGPA